MSTSGYPEAPPASDVAFDVERFEWTAVDRLEVAGRWSGVRGRRFMRPSLNVAGNRGRRRLIALLEHKPWAADDGDHWVAAFPWDGERGDVGPAVLEVGTGLAVELPAPREPRHVREAAAKLVDAPPTGPATPLSPPRTAEDQRDEELWRARAAVGAARREADLAREQLNAVRERARLQVRDAEAGRIVAERERDRLRQEVDAIRELAMHDVAAAREAAEAQVVAARAQADAQVAEASESAAVLGRALEERNAEVEARHAEVQQLGAAIDARERELAGREAVTRERDEARRARDAALAERDAAVRARQEAMAQHDSLIAERDRAVRERRTAVAERDATRRERDAAVGARDAALADRDRVLRVRSGAPRPQAGAVEPAVRVIGPVEPAERVEHEPPSERPASDSGATVDSPAVRAQAVSEPPSETPQPHLPLIDDAAGWSSAAGHERKPLLTRAEPLGRSGGARVTARAVAIVVLLVAVVALVVLLSAML
jgi:hypothetical protein